MAHPSWAAAAQAYLAAPSPQSGEGIKTIALKGEPFIFAIFI
jgi:hypothetical protein